MVFPSRPSSRRRTRPAALRHLQDGAGLGFDPPFLGSGADGLAGELGDGVGVAGAGYGEVMAWKSEARAERRKGRARSL
jgi:hypothetical protein